MLTVVAPPIASPGSTWYTDERRRRTIRRTSRCKVFGHGHRLDRSSRSGHAARATRGAAPVTENATSGIRIVEVGILSYLTKETCGLKVLAMPGQAAIYIKN